MRYLFLNLFLVSLLFAQAPYTQPTFGMTLDLEDPINNDLVGCWPFSDGLGTTVTDVTNNGYNGNLTNMVPSSDWVNGKNGFSLDFDGTDDYVINGDFEFLTPPITICAWAYNEFDPSLNFFRSVVSKGGVFENDTNFDFGIRQTAPNNQVYCYWRNGSTLYGTQLDATYFNTRRWGFIVATIDKSYNLEIFVNAISIGTDGSNAVPTDGGDSLKFGQWSGNQSTSDEFLGNIENIRIYNRVLSDAEIKRLYYEPYAGFKSDQTISMLKTEAAAAEPAERRNKIRPRIWGKIYNQEDLLAEMRLRLMFGL